MTVSFSLTEVSSRYVHNQVDGVRLRVAVECAEGASPKIFAYRALPLRADADERVAKFSHICSSVDLAAYPEDAPDDDTIPEWFRLDYVDLLLPDSITANTIRQQIYDDVELLRRSIESQADLNGQHRVDFAGGCAVDDGEASTSASDSGSDSPSTPLYGAVSSLTVESTSTTDAGTGVSWVHEEVSPGIYQSSATLNQSQLTKLLVLGGFDCQEIPDTAVIDGIVVDLVIRGDDDSANLLLHSVGIHLLGAESPQYLYPNTPLPDDWTILEFGGATDTWNMQLTGRDLKVGNLGIGLTVKATPTHVALSADAAASQLTIYHRPVIG